MTSRWPDLVALELLAAVADQGSIGAAARTLRIAQPNASRNLAALEAQLGVRLLVRHPRGARLTPEGQRILQAARQVLTAADALMTEAAATNEQLSGHLDVAASQTIAEQLLPAWLAAAHAARPGLEVRLKVCNSEEVFDLVEAGRYELGFVETPEVRPGLRSAVVGRDELVVVVPPSHPWTSGGPITAAELAATRLVLREPGSGGRATLDAALRGEGPARAALELGSNAAVREGVLAGAGPGVISELAALSDPRLVVVPTAGMLLGRELRAVWRGRPTAAASWLVRLAEGAARRQIRSPGT
ncbi:LysR family transcriptional regulator [Tessaracoccus palaemonis]|uniref:LysR family transcriptional regulator n=1 Tax=Tessaracoccus palaemonis TaxID=2829499 RepID=A0ABX8SEN4_9ACTN|nr:LysR family transcriptional regulator [Tessaracoccus palaemonis]QXT61861.1 LysR family transcriptional regulator [Tessaracoccus palaemonis]